MLAQFGGERVVGLIAARGVTKATMACPVIGSAAPITAASATAGWLTSALSISIVPMRWPETLSTSSTRPNSQ